MPLPFDATLKDLVRSHPADWLGAVVPSAEPIKPVDIDLSVLSAQADCALGVGDPLAWILHLEFQSSRDDSLVRRVLMYNAILHCRLNVPVHSVAVLLRPAAACPEITGHWEYFGKGSNSSVRFQYEVLRVWERSAEEYLQGSLGLLPLAPLGAMPKGADLAPVIERLAERISNEAAPAEAGKLFTAAFVLTGMRVSKEKVLQLFQGVRAMRESTAYQAILDEGRVEGRAEGQLNEAVKLILRLAPRKCGKPTPADESALRAITDLERLERISDRMFDVASWQDLLATP